MRTALLVFVLALPAAGFAQTEELENPGTVYAIQERTYRMNHELTLGIGSLPIDAFYKGFYGTLSYTYHFTDAFAWTVGRGAYSQSINTGLRDQLERDFGVLPTAFEEVQWFAGSDIMLSPFYGKATLFNKSVLYFEQYFLLGGTIFKFNNSFKPGVNLGLGVRLFYNKYVSFRIEATDNVIITDKPFNVMTVTLMLALNFGATE